MNQSFLSSTSRRNFIKTSAVLGGALLAPIGFSAGALPTLKSLKVGLIGCGGRGTGAANQALTPITMSCSPRWRTFLKTACEIRSLEALQKENPEKVQVPAEKLRRPGCISKSDRQRRGCGDSRDPARFSSAASQGRGGRRQTYFLRKTGGDGRARRPFRSRFGCRSQEKETRPRGGLLLALQHAERALFQQIHSGAIGDLRAMYATYYTGPVKPMPPSSDRPDGMSDVEWQLRNWYNFVWLCGDSLVDKPFTPSIGSPGRCGDIPPLKCVAVGGRQIPANGGNIFDHFEINYEYADNVRAFLGCRQIPNCANDNTATFYGSKGSARELGFAGMPFIKGETKWKYDGERPDMYQMEHNELFASIRAGKPINDGERMAHRHLWPDHGTHGRLHRQEITWDMAMNSQEKLVPDDLTWDAECRSNRGCPAKRNSSGKKIMPMKSPLATPNRNRATRQDSTGPSSFNLGLVVRS